MNLTIKINLIFLVVFLISNKAIAQRDTINTDKLIIVKQYSPTVNDAFKIKQKPSEKDSIKQLRRDFSYSFIDVPVASTFTPAKGTASGVRMSPPDKLFENYSRFGVGNFSTILADFYSNFDINRDRHLDIAFNHLSSQGGIDGVVLDDDFSNTNVRFDLTSQDRYFDWNTGFDVNHREVNYYGLESTLANALSQDQLKAIDPKQTYTKLEAFGGIRFTDLVLKEADITVYNFTDNFSSSEQLLDIQPLVEIPLRTQNLSIKGDFKFLNGSFEERLIGDGSLDYQQFQAGINPFMKFNIQNVNLKLGAKAVFFSDMENSENKVFFYPDIKAEFSLNQETIKVFLGVDGSLEQNTYENLSQQNPFLSPTQFIRPSNNQYNAFAGFTTKLLENLSLSSQINYSSTNNTAFFISNPDIDYGNGQSKRGFDYRNSFSVVYNDLETFGISADLAYQIDSDFNIGFFGKYSDFSTGNGEPAWNLPEVELRAYADFNFTKNWNFSAALFYIGERNDALENISIDSNSFPISSGRINNTVDGYLDLNASLEYKINPRLAVFVNGNNLLNNSYNRWQNFEVQGIQVLGGLTYQFNW
jgi:hypothetical protein